MPTNDMTIVIPAYNESQRIGSVLRPLVEKYDYEVLVIDDCSSDETAAIAAEHGATVERNNRNRGYLETLKRGLQATEGKIIVTMDADGEHRPEDVETLVKPIVEDQLDLVFGKRETYPRPSERFISQLVALRVGVVDSGSGFRAFRRKLADQLMFHGECTCGTLALEAHKLGARIGEVPAPSAGTDKPRRVAWWHWKQLVHVARCLT
jgi:glycosyltransferase involved in cell wall biosynthesis